MKGGASTSVTPFHMWDRSSTDRSSSSQPAVMVCCAGSVNLQIQPGTYVLDRAGSTAPTRPHGLDHTDQGSIRSERSGS